LRPDYHEGALDSLTAQERIALFKLFIDPEDRIALRWLLIRSSTVGAKSWWRWQHEMPYQPFMSGVSSLRPAA
jgi:hypothetical protein